MTKNFLDILDKTPHEHYSFEKAIASICGEKKVFQVTTQKPVISLKFVWDLFNLRSYLFDQMDSHTSNSAEISTHAVIEGKVVIEDGAKVLEGAKVKEGSYIGKNSVIGTNAILRSGSSVGEGCTVGASTEVKNSLIFDNTSIHSGFLGDSIVGENNKLAANFVTANKRMDRSEISVEIEGEKVETGLKAFGVITGSDVQTGVSVSVMPGVIIGNGSIVGPGTNVMKNVPDDTKFYATFKENIEKAS